MLKTINPLLSGHLLKLLANMGHGDDIVVVDANYPATTMAQRLVHLPGVTATAALDAILTLLPVDDFVERPVVGMAAPDERPPIYAEFDALLHQHEGRTVSMELVDRFAFYERSKQAYAIVSTGERRLYANLIIKKGVLRAD